MSILSPRRSTRSAVQRTRDTPPRSGRASRALRRRLDEDSDVAVRVDVDESRCDVHAGRIDLPGCLRAAQATDASDLASTDSEVCDAPRRACAVENATPPDDDVEHHRDMGTMQVFLTPSSRSRCFSADQPRPRPTDRPPRSFLIRLAIVFRQASNSPYLELRKLKAIPRHERNDLDSDRRRHRGGHRGNWTW